MKNAIWLALCTTVAGLLLTIGSLNAEDLNDVQNGDVSTNIENTGGLNLDEQGSQNFYYYGAGYYYPHSVYYPYLRYYPYYGYYGMPFTRTILR